MKYIMPTKGIGMRRIIEKRFNVVLIDELCSKCHHELTNYKNIHRLLVCSHCKSNGLESKNITFMNRDMNACMNMLNLSKQWINTKTRPENTVETLIMTPILEKNIIHQLFLPRIMP